MGEVVVLLVLVAVVLGGVGLYRRHAVNQRKAEEQAALETQLSTSKRAADEDVTKFGEELQRLDSDVAGHALDEPMQQDYQRALDAYDNAKMSLDAVTKPDEIRHVTEILEDGRYAVACVKARIAGEPLPAKRPPCFFNPAHGPSSQRRRLGAARWRRPLRPGLPGRRRAGAGRRRPVHPDGAGRSPAGALLGGRPGVRAVGPGLLQPVERQRHALGHADRRHALRRHGQHVRRCRRRPRRRWRSATASATSAAGSATASATSAAVIGDMFGDMFD